MTLYLKTHEDEAITRQSLQIALLSLRYEDVVALANAIEFQRSKGKVLGSTVVAAARSLWKPPAPAAVPGKPVSVAANQALGKTP